MVHPDDLIETAAIVFDLPRETLLGPSRVAHVSQARQALMLALRRRTRLALKEIGARIGGRDHTTVLEGIAQAERRCLHDAEYRALVGALLDVPDPAPIRTADVRLRWALATYGGIVPALAA